MFVSAMFTGGNEILGKTYYYTCTHTSRSFHNFHFAQSDPVFLFILSTLV